MVRADGTAGGLMVLSGSERAVVHSVSGSTDKTRSTLLRVYRVKALSKVWGGWKTRVSRRKHTRAWRSVAGTFPLGAATRASLFSCSSHSAACSAAERCAILHAASDAPGKAAGAPPSRNFRACRQPPLLATPTYLVSRRLPP